MLKNEDFFITFFLVAYEWKQETHNCIFSLFYFTRYILAAQIKKINQEHDLQEYWSAVYTSICVKKVKVAVSEYVLTFTCMCLCTLY